jgi:hypothetical protein
MPLAPEPHERDMANPPGGQPTNAGADESEIDRILADSFPASDAPPWTLGVQRRRAAGMDDEVACDNDQEDPVRRRSHQGKP